MGGHIHSTADYDEYTGPGLYHLYNVDGGSMLDNGGTGHWQAHGWHFEEGNQNQIWMIAAVSGNRLMFICRKDNGLLGMGDEGPNGRASGAAAGGPENEANQWYIEHSDGDRKKFYIKNVKHHARVLELQEGGEEDKTQSSCSDVTTM
ncbi:MAG: hypothetical protein MMC23_007140 [Stictis urceolatum]|nr:hypothetical protein [Stictis urceolata]